MWYFVKGWKIYLVVLLCFVAIIAAPAVHAATDDSLTLAPSKIVVQTFWATQDDLSGVVVQTQVDGTPKANCTVQIQVAAVSGQPPIITQSVPCQNLAKGSYLIELPRQTSSKNVIYNLTLVANDASSNTVRLLTRPSSAYRDSGLTVAAIPQPASLWLDLQYAPETSAGDNVLIIGIILMLIAALSWRIARFWLGNRRF